jgi:hypothetical protein
MAMARAGPDNPSQHNVIRHVQKVFNKADIESGCRGLAGTARPSLGTFQAFFHPKGRRIPSS